MFSVDHVHNFVYAKDNVAFRVDSLISSGSFFFFETLPMFQLMVMYFKRPYSAFWSLQDHKVNPWIVCSSRNINQSSLSELIHQGWQLSTVPTFFTVSGRVTFCLSCVYCLLRYFKSKSSLRMQIKMVRIKFYSTW